MKKLIKGFCDWFTSKYKWIKSRRKMYVSILISIGTFISALVLLGVSFLKIEIEFNPKKFLVAIIVMLLGLIVGFIIDYYSRKKKLRDKHYDLSYPIIEVDIPDAFSQKSVLASDIENNKKIDVIIKPPLDYVLETLNGNFAPTFNPNEDYFDEMFSETTTHIIVITAENPSLSVDPTISFFMSNCEAVTLLRHIQSNPNKRLTTMDFETNEKYRRFYSKITEEIITKLQNDGEISMLPNSFEFIRFIMYNEKDKKYLQDGVFPAFKSTQDLFRIKSFFIAKDSMKNDIIEESIYNRYEVDIRSIWEEIKTKYITKYENRKEFSKQIDKKINDIIPEFVLFFKSDKILLYTYIHGDYCWIKINRDDIRIKDILSCLATCYKIQEENESNWNPTITDNLNKKWSYLCFKSEIEEFKKWL